ncbi:helix-turn-helix domain-containing protein [Amycolatopsis dendrobii]|uniref:Helix-turn-helix transcriptional regulator n=1 Tax=Amycolatopsis dendrobii TaxID=2760662 RepID=A0A7W3VVW9_9PSEU|nr:helix-turn-helix transcriptional regulator [Amycolatopsis dendrobii]MBB1153979.1 helix-turn-helix transcriptional regulator [Amycolatopsis dendrobii]
MSLGNHLRGLREQTGLTQRDVARRMGCADSTVSMIETDTREPRLKMLRRYCDAIGARVYIGFPTKEAP